MLGWDKTNEDPSKYNAHPKRLIAQARLQAERRQMFCHHLLKMLVWSTLLSLRLRHSVLPILTLLFAHNFLVNLPSTSPTSGLRV